MQEISIKFISDVSCPWCAVGYNELKQAMAIVSVNVKLEWLPFEINPNMDKAGLGVSSYLAQKYGMTKEVQLQNMANIESRGEAAGFEFKPMIERHVYNSFDCHCLLYLAKERPFQTSLKEAFFTAYFQQGLDISDRTVLMQCAQKVGMVDTEIIRAFDDEMLREEVKLQLQQVSNYGITSVPSLLINDKYLVSGAQGVDGYLAMFKQLAAWDK